MDEPLDQDSLRNVINALAEIGPYHHCIYAVVSVIDSTTPALRYLSLPSDEGRTDLLLDLLHSALV